MGATQVTAFLNHLTTDGHVAASTQNQALTRMRNIHHASKVGQTVPCQCVDSIDNSILSQVSTDSSKRRRRSVEFFRFYAWPKQPLTPANQLLFHLSSFGQRLFVDRVENFFRREYVQVYIGLDLDLVTP